MSIETTIREVSAKLKNLSPQATEVLSKKLEIDHLEYFSWQQRKSLAFANDLCSLEDANFIFRCLGSGPADFNNQPLATRVVITQAMALFFGAMLVG